MQSYLQAGGLSLGMFLAFSLPPESCFGGSVDLDLLGKRNQDPLPAIFSDRSDNATAYCHDCLQAQPANVEWETRFHSLGPVLDQTSQLQAAIAKKVAMINSTGSDSICIAQTFGSLGEAVNELHTEKPPTSPTVIFNYYINKPSFTRLLSLLTIQRGVLVYPEVIISQRLDLADVVNLNLGFSNDLQSKFMLQSGETTGSYLFPYPHLLDSVEAALTFVHRMGWKRVALIGRNARGNRELSKMSEHAYQWNLVKTIGREHIDGCIEEYRNATKSDSCESTVFQFHHLDHRANSTFGRILSQLEIHEFDLFLQQDLDALIESLYRKELRIFVFVGPVSQYTSLLLAAHKRLMYGMGFVWIMVHHYLDFPGHFNLPALLESFSFEERNRIVEALSGSLTIGPTSGYGEELQPFLDSQEPWRQNSGQLHPLLQTVYAWDAAETVARIAEFAIADKAARLGLSPGSAVTLELEDVISAWPRALDNISFDGLSGPVSFSNLGARTTITFSVKNFVPLGFESNGTDLLYTECENVSYPWVIETRARLTTYHLHSTLVFLDGWGSEVNSSTLVFGGGLTWIPFDGPNAFLLLPDLGQTERLGINFVFWFVAVIAMGLYLLWMHRHDNKALLYDNSWIYGMKDINFRMRRGFLELFSIPACQENDCLTAGASFDGKPVKFEKEGLLNGKRVYLKGVPVLKDQITLKIRAEIMQIRALEHPNVCAFIGCIFLNRTTIKLTEFCDKKSLHSILTNTKVQLDWACRYNFAMDAARGLRYLHSKKVIHSRLSIMNCVVDGKWNLKLSDYGLESLQPNVHLHKRSTFRKKFSSKVTEQVMFAAPEIKLLGNKHTCASDVYSLGIVFSTIASRNLLLGLSSESKNLTSLSSSKAFDKDVPYFFLELMAECSNNTPPSRPAAETVLEKLKRLDPKTSVVADSAVLSLLESYSKSLEDLMEERNDWAKMEKRHLETANYCCVPSCLTESLLKGENIGPRRFSNASAVVFEFSPVAVGSCMDQAGRVEEFIEEIGALHSKFDSITEGCNVHRVHQGSNTYVLVSGVHGNEGTSTAELCRLALHLICEAMSPPSPSLSSPSSSFPSSSFASSSCNQQGPVVCVKAGLHTGPLTCGVVGTKHSTYSVYGAGMEVAKRLALEGTHGEIHMSQAAKELLSDLHRKISITACKKVKLQEEDRLATVYNLSCSTLKRVTSLKS